MRLLLRCGTSDLVKAATGERLNHGGRYVQGNRREHRRTARDCRPCEPLFGKAGRVAYGSGTAVFRRHLARRATTRDSNRTFDEKLTSGQRLADKVAEFGGSWTFIMTLALALALWVGANVLATARAFDPYPFIFLNLILSMLAAVQAPVIMMSQNRHSIKDRVDATHDYEVNLKPEIEIMALHDKLIRCVTLN